MTDYMSLHESAYPPSDWHFLPNRQSKPSPNSNNQLWAEMTDQYNQSMAMRHHLITSNFLSATATRQNICRMDREVCDRYRQRGTIAFEDAADVEDTLDIATEWAKKVTDLAENPMETIQEVDEGDEATEIEENRTEQAIDIWEGYERLKNSNEIDRSFKARLMDISSTCYDFIHAHIGDRPRPQWDEICDADKEVNSHLASVQKRATNDVAQLRDFLRARLFDQYCLMRSTPEAEKDPAWLEHGRGIVSGFQNSDSEVVERLHRMIEESGLDSMWVKSHIVDYHRGNENIGQWQRYVRARRWMDLAQKFITDIQQLEKINSARPSGSRRCKIMSNIHNSKQQFFKRLEWPQIEYELSEKALSMGEEDYESSLTMTTSLASSSASSATSRVTVS